MAALSSSPIARPGAKPLEPFGKGSNALKAGTPDAGPSSPYRAFVAAVRSAPGRGRAEAGHIRGRRGKASGDGGAKQPVGSFNSGPPSLRLRRALAHFRKPHRKLDRFAHLACADAMGR